MLVVLVITIVIYFLEIIGQMKNKQLKLNILKEPLWESFLNLALLIAVQSGDSNSVSKLILYGATNFDMALAESCKFKQSIVTATLLLIKAAMENIRFLS